MEPGLYLDPEEREILYVKDWWYTVVTSPHEYRIGNHRSFRAGSARHSTLQLLHYAATLPDVKLEHPELFI